MRNARLIALTVIAALKTKLTLVVFCLLLGAFAWAQGLEDGEKRSREVFTVTDLGPLAPAAINNVGQVVGDYNGHAFMWTQFGGMRDLGILSGGTFSSAAAINDLGTVTGIADGPFTVTLITPDYPFPLSQECSELTQPFVWAQRDGMQGLGTIIQFLPLAEALYFAGDWCDLPFRGRGINVHGQIVGYEDSYNTYQWGFLWTSADGMKTFGGSWPPTFINGISNTGQIVGQNSAYPLTRFLGHATSWKNGVSTDLGTLGGNSDMGFPMGYSSSANGVNDRGQIVGWSTTTPIFENLLGWTGSSPIHAILWSTRGGMRDLGTLPGDEFSAASKINFFGRIIGISGNTVEFNSDSQRYEVIGHPFIWTRHSGMQDLNTLISPNSGWVLNSVSDINLWGQIVGSGTLNGQSHGFLLTPRFL
jgi:probable HAF family extracellular repeat protein